MKKFNTVYLAWQSTATRDWSVVGLLKESGNEYTFNYTQGAKNDAFVPFSGMEHLDQTYKSRELFPLFKNRLLSSKRPEYPDFIKWLKLDEKDETPINILSRSGGTRETDQLQMFKKLEVCPDGSFEHNFFAHGLGHLDESASKRVSKLKAGDILFLCIDCQNKYDEYAILIRADRPTELLGYCPRYLASDISSLLSEDRKSLELTVEAISDHAPSNYRLMCKLTGKMKPELKNQLMDNEEYKPICTAL